MNFDPKSIGLAAKDIVIGIGTAAAGASGGPAAAEGVGKAGSGLDRILSMTGVMESRGDKFDRADFAARPPTASAMPKTGTNTPPQTSPALPAEPETATTSRTEEGPYTGDEKRAVDHLQSLGWSHPKIRQILSGPEQTSLAAVVGKDTKGVRARGIPGTALPQAAFALPTTIIILRPVLMAIPTELEEAAVLDGAGRIQFFWRIVVPLSGPGVVTVGVLAFVASWNAYLLPLLLLQEDRKTLPLGVADFFGHHRNAFYGDIKPNSKRQRFKHASCGYRLVMSQ